MVSWIDLLRHTKRKFIKARKRSSWNNQAEYQIEFSGIISEKFSPWNSNVFFCTKFFDWTHVFLFYVRSWLKWSVIQKVGQVLFSTIKRKWCHLFKNTDIFYLDIINVYGLNNMKRGSNVNSEILHIALTKMSIIEKLILKGW